MRLYQLAPMLYRGSRPTSSDLTRLQGRGIRSILSLEGPEEDKREADEFAPAQISVTSFPISDWPQIYWSGISQEYLAVIVHQMQFTTVPLLVHCQHGQDRTGLAVAAWRVTVCGWSKHNAWQEAKDFGYHRWLNRGLNKTWGKFTGPKQ